MSCVSLEQHLGYILWLRSTHSRTESKQMCEYSLAKPERLHFGLVRFLFCVLLLHNHFRSFSLLLLTCYLLTYFLCCYLHVGMFLLVQSLYSLLRQCFLFLFVLPSILSFNSYIFLSDLKPGCLAYQGILDHHCKNSISVVTFLEFLLFKWNLILQQFPAFAFLRNTRSLQERNICSFLSNVLITQVLVLFLFYLLLSLFPLLFR